MCLNMFSFIHAIDGELKFEKQLEKHQPCIQWTHAVFNLDDNGKTVSCISTHLTTMETATAGSDSQDSFVLNVLRKLKNTKTR